VVWVGRPGLARASNCPPNQIIWLWRGHEAIVCSHGILYLMYYCLPTTSPSRVSMNMLCGPTTWPYCFAGIQPTVCPQVTTVLHQAYADCCGDRQAKKQNGKYLAACNTYRKIVERAPQQKDTLFASQQVTDTQTEGQTRRQQTQQGVQTGKQTLERGRMIHRWKHTIRCK
jgi:hypothetical protein